MRTTLEFVCENCGNKVFREPRKINPGQRLHFCNRECWRQYKDRQDVSDKFLAGGKLSNAERIQKGIENRESKTKLYVCDKCKKKFKRITSWGERENGTFCSRTCTGKSRLAIGKFKARIFRSRQTIKMAIKVRYIDQCAICHWSEAPCDGHHIHPIKEDGLNVLSNLVILCPNHHRMADYGLITHEELEKARQVMVRIPDIPEAAYIDYDGTALP